MEHSGLVALLRDDKHADLARMHALFRRVDGGLALLRAGLGDHVKEMGAALPAASRSSEPSLLLCQPATPHSVAFRCALSDFCIFVAEPPASPSLNPPQTLNQSSTPRRPAAGDGPGALQGAGGLRHPPAGGARQVRNRDFARLWRRQDLPQRAELGAPRRACARARGGGVAEGLAVVVVGSGLACRVISLRSGAARRFRFLSSHPPIPAPQTPQTPARPSSTF